MENYANTEQHKSFTTLRWEQKLKIQRFVQWFIESVSGADPLNANAMDQ